MLFPPPLPTFLEMHYAASIAKAMKGGGDDYELDADNEDEDTCELEDTFAN